MLSGTNIENYRNLQLLFSSHEGELYLTDDPKIIIKVYYFNNQYIDKEDIIKITRVSVHLSEQISEHIPKIYLVYETSNYIALAMDLIQGTTLQYFLKFNKSHNIKVIFKIVKSLYNAVISLHNIGYSHNDLHHKNIIITNEYQAKLIDFGNTDIINIESRYHDYLMLKASIARLIFEGLNDLSVVKIMENIKTYTITNVIGYNENAKIAQKLYNILNSFPKEIENDLD